MASLAQINIRFNADLKSFKEQIQGAEKQIAAVSKKIRNTGAAMSLAVTGPLLLLGRASAQMWDQQSKAIALVESRLNSTNGALGITSDQLQKMAGELQNNSLFGDTDILQKVTGQLISFGNIAESEFGRAQQAIIDIAAAMDQDLQATTSMIGRALEDPIKGLNRLSRAGIVFSASQMEVIKSLQESGRNAEAQKIILAELERQYGGAAKAIADSGLGPLQQLQGAWQGIQRQFGEVLLDYINPLAKSLKDILNRFQNLSPTTKKWVVIIGGIAAAIGPILALAGTILPALISGFTILLGPVGLVLAALAAIAYVVIRNWGKISEWIQRVKNRITEAAGESQFLQDVIKGIGIGFKSLYEIGSLVFKSLGTIIDLFVDNALNAFSSFGKVMDAIFSGDLKSIPGIISDAFQQGANDLGKAIQTAKSDIENTISNISDIASGRVKIKVDPVEKEKTRQEVETFSGDLGDILEDGISDGIAEGFKEGVRKARLDISEWKSFFDEFIRMSNIQFGVWRDLAEKAMTMPPIQMYDMKAPLSEWTIAMHEFNEQVSQQMMRFQESLIVGFAEGIGAIIAGATSFGSVLSGLLGMMSDFVVQIGKMAIQHGIAMQAIKMSFANPLAAIAAGVALVAIGTAMRGLFKSSFGGAPQMAAGGIVSGRTLVEVGEYANAPINPEVIAPLDKLQSMINSEGSFPERVTLRAKGDELISVIRRTDLINSKA